MNNTRLPENLPITEIDRLFFGIERTKNERMAVFYMIKFLGLNKFDFLIRGLFSVHTGIKTSVNFKKGFFKKKSEVIDKYLYDYETLINEFSIRRWEKYRNKKGFWESRRFSSKHYLDLERDKFLFLRNVLDYFSNWAGGMFASFTEKELTDRLYELLEIASKFYDDSFKFSIYGDFTICDEFSQLSISKAKDVKNGMPFNHINFQTENIFQKSKHPGKYKGDYNWVCDKIPTSFGFNHNKKFDDTEFIENEDHLFCNSPYALFCEDESLDAEVYDGNEDLELEFTRQNGDEVLKQTYNQMKRYTENPEYEILAILSFCYEFGIGVQKNIHFAERGYVIAASRNVGLALIRLAFLKGYGRPGVYIDRRESNLNLKRLRKIGVSAIKWLEKAGKWGNSFAQYCLGSAYHDGFGVVADENLCVYWYIRSALQGNKCAISILGNCFIKGIGVKTNEKIAFNLYRTCASFALDPIAMYNLGYCYETGKGITVDMWNAFVSFARSALLLNPFAFNSLGFFYEEGEEVGIRKDLLISRKLYEISAHMGYFWAQANLGYCFQRGIGTNVSFEKSYYWYKRAAIQGLSRAEHNLGNIFLQGLGIERDVFRALEYYFRASAKANVYAYHSLASCYQNGDGVLKNEDKAIDYYKMAAKAKFVPSLISLSFCSRMGAEGRADARECFKNMIKAANMGNSYAQNCIGFFYEEGYGVEKNIRKAVEWYLKSAQQENPWAQCNLGCIFFEGIEAKINRKRAIKYFIKSAKNNHPRAYEKLAYCFEKGVVFKRDYRKAFIFYKYSADNGYTKSFYELARCYEIGMGCEIDIHKALDYYYKSAYLGNFKARVKLKEILLIYSGTCHNITARCP